MQAGFNQCRELQRFRHLSRHLKPLCQGDIQAMAILFPEQFNACLTQDRQEAFITASLHASTPSRPLWTLFNMPNGTAWRNKTVAVPMPCFGMVSAGKGIGGRGGHSIFRWREATPAVTLHESYHVAVELQKHQWMAVCSHNNGMPLIITPPSVINPLVRAIPVTPSLSPLPSANLR